MSQKLHVLAAIDDQREQVKNQKFHQGFIPNFVAAIISLLEVWPFGSNRKVLHVK